MMAKNSFVAEVTFKCDESHLLMVPKQGWGHTISKETLDFLGLLCYSPERTKFHTWKFHKIVIHPLEISWSKAKAPRNFSFIF